MQPVADNVFSFDLTLDSAKSVMLVIYAALVIQERCGVADKMDQESLRTLREMKEVKSGSTGEVFPISEGEKERWLSDYLGKISAYRHPPVGKIAVHERMQKIIASFKLLWHEQHYAGYETQFRLRLQEMTKAEDISTASDEAWQSEAVRFEAANYMAFTAYYMVELARCKMA